MNVADFWQYEPIDIFIFLEERSNAKREEEQQQWDYVRHIMVAAMQPYSEEKIKFSDIIGLDRDGVKSKELSPFEKQELKRWSAKCDEEMIRDGAVLVDWDGNPIN